MRIDIYLHDGDVPSTVNNKLNLILDKLDQVLNKEDKMSAELDALQAQVQANEDLEGSAIQLIQGLADQIVAAGTDPAKLAALTTGLKTSADALAAAISANTPSAPTP